MGPGMCLGMATNGPVVHSQIGHVPLRSQILHWKMAPFPHSLCEGLCEMPSIFYNILHGVYDGTAPGPVSVWPLLNVHGIKRQ